jgi:2-oxoglutarate ferredoxin oxidoreductase subunit gamma
MYQGIRIAGFGGQGVISAGVLIAQAGVIEGKEVSFFPAYGAEMRGGTANCSVVVSDEEVTTPIVSRPDTVIVMNEPSLAKFEPMVKPGGVLIINTSLVNSKPTRTDVRIVNVPCDDIAAKEIGNPKTLNMVMLGAFAKATGAISLEAVKAALPKVYKKLAKKPEVLALNEKAFLAGAAAVK